MANNNIVSPGIYINETDQSFIPEGIIEAGAALVGSTAKGPVRIPTLVSSYPDFVAKFGAVIESGSGADITTHPSLQHQIWQHKEEYQSQKLKKKLVIP